MSNSEKLISIIVPVYKVEKYLRRCIDSILSQTYKNFEVILVDDGSPDACPGICDEYAVLYDNITVVHKENMGVSAARNSGLDLANGQYVIFIDSDDFVHEDLLNSLIIDLHTHKVSLSMTSYKRVYNMSKIVDTHENAVKVINDLEAMNMLLEDQSRCAPWAKLYDIKLFSALRFPEGKIMEDMFIMPIIFERAKFISVNSQELYYYNQEGESITRSSFNLNKLDMVDAAFFWKTHCSIYYPELTTKSKMHYFTVAINNCVYLSTIEDILGKYKYQNYKSEIGNNIFFIIISKYSTINTKIKAILVMIRFFYAVYKFNNFFRYWKVRLQNLYLSQ